MATKEETFYLVSALRADSGPLGSVKSHEKESDAIECAKWVINKRRESGEQDIPFYILKVVAKVQTEVRPIKVTKIGRR